MNRYENVICKENLKSFKKKVHQLQRLIFDKKRLEQTSVDLCINALAGHGKSREMTGHIAKISRVLAQSLGMSKSDCEKLEQAASIYDIGNLLICSDVYLKDGALEPHEFDIVKNHTLWGYNILARFHFPITDIAALISAEHHEWYNGKGYPKGLKGTEIDIAARIVAVADSIGSLFAERPGRESWDLERIMHHIETQSGIKFDPKVAKACLANKETIEQILYFDCEMVKSA